VAHNPYQSPESNLGAPEVAKYSLLWKIYFFFITLLSILGFAALYFDPDFGIAEIFSIILGVPATTGLFGYTFRKKILDSKFWNIFFFGYIIWSVIYMFVSKINQQASMTDNEYIISMIIGWGLSIPAYLALFFYGRSSCSVWQKTA